MGRRIFDRRILRDDLDADAGIGAHRAQPDLFELVTIQVRRVGIERGHHAANGLLHEGMVIDVIDVFVLDSLVNFGEQARFLPRKGIGAFRWACGIGALPGQHATSHGAGKTKDRPRDESDHVRDRVDMSSNPPVWCNSRDTTRHP